MTNIHLIKTKNSVTKAAAQNKQHPTNCTTINIEQANFGNSIQQNTWSFDKPQTSPISTKSGPCERQSPWLPIPTNSNVLNSSNQQLRMKTCPRAQLKRTLYCQHLVQSGSLNAHFEARAEERQKKKTMASSNNSDATPPLYLRSPSPVDFISTIKQTSKTNFD